MGRAEEYERTLLKIAEFLEGDVDADGPVRAARICRLVVDGMNLEAAINVAHYHEAVAERAAKRERQP